MAERKNFWRPLIVGGVSLVIASGACIAVERGDGDDREDLGGSVLSLDLTPTPTRTPLIFEGRTRSLTHTATPTPKTAETSTETPFIPQGMNQDFTEPPASTFRPIWTPKPIEATPTIPVVTFAPTPLSTPEATIVPTPEMSMEVWASELFGLVNQFRAENGVKALNRNALLDQSTKQYSEYLIAENKIFEEHIHDQNGSPLDRANTISNIWFYVGEVEVHFPVYGTTPRMMMDWWIGSTPHRNALLSFPNPNPDERITEFGIGCAWGEYSFPNGMKSMYVVCNGALGILNPTPTPAAIH